MTRFVTAAAVAAVLALSAGKADAQYYYRYYPTPGGGVGITQQFYGLGNVQTYNSVSSPYGFRQSAYYGDVFGNTAGRASGYSPYYGGYNRGYNYAAPSLYNPYGAYNNYGFYRRW